VPRKPSKQLASFVSTFNVVPFRTVGSELISSKAAWMATAETPPVVEFNWRIDPIFTTGGLAAKLLEMLLGNRSRDRTNNMRKAISIVPQMVQKLLDAYPHASKL
jgi:hypothetical protein